MYIIGIVGIFAIISICICLVGISLSLDRIRDELERIASKMRKGGE